MMLTSNVVDGLSCHRGSRHLGAVPRVSSSACPRPLVQRRAVASRAIPVHKEGLDWLETLLSRFGPVKGRAAQVATLDFEKPLQELDKRIKDVRVLFPTV